ncbi:hypothetical protein Y032_0102g3446 [Ancylostoma ceylanicum]|nr:hypothetical protein Y032_0102g3446 [Ancylostoma ceylanicum]
MIDTYQNRFYSGNSSARSYATRVAEEERNLKKNLCSKEQVFLLQQGLHAGSLHRLNVGGFAGAPNA